MIARCVETVLGLGQEIERRPSRDVHINMNLNTAAREW